MRYFDKQNNASEGDEDDQDTSEDKECGSSETVGEVNTNLCNEDSGETSKKPVASKAKRRRKKKKGSLPDGSKTENNGSDTEPIPPKVLEKYSHGEGINVNNISSITHRKKLILREKKLQWAEEQAARTEVLQTEDSGFLIPEEGEQSYQMKQSDIKKAVDILSAAKCFDLDLSYGPYRIDYTRNGSHLLIGGKRGHVAAFNWITKHLMFEMNVMEEVYDIQWLHIETMFAVAQKNWVYIYDNQGVELHCLKTLYKVLQMTFLPYHFLLATSNEVGWLSWLDVSIGEIVTQFNTRQGRLDVMVQNPYNGILCLGHSKGVVSMWSPNSKKPVAQILCHNKGIQAIAVDHTGTYMATSSSNRNLKIWDVRQLVGPIQNYFLKGSPSNLSFSQKGLLATGIGNTIEVFKNCHKCSVKDSYLRARSIKSISSLEFCPYEDVLGFGTWGGFSSILVPGAGEPNFDALECNPMRTKKQRQEAEVKSLLEKIQPEMICLDPAILTEVDIPTLKDKIDAKKQLLYLKPPKVDFEPRRKKKHGNTVRAAKVKKIVQDAAKKKFINQMKEVGKELLNEIRTETTEDKVEKKKNVLDRFRSKAHHL